MFSAKYIFLPALLIFLFLSITTKCGTVTNCLKRSTFQKEYSSGSIEYVKPLSLNFLY